MEQGIETARFEVVCKATDCIYNDTPVCMEHTLRQPIVIEHAGTCLRHKTKEDLSQLVAKNQ